MTQAHLELLQRMPIFGALRDDALQLLLDHARKLAVRSGDFFVRQDDPAESMFVLESGRAAVIRGWQGRSVLLHHLVAGDCFGEMALMDLMPRSASVRAEEDCLALELTSSDLLLLYEHDLEQFALLQMNLGREVCRRLRSTDEMLFRARMGEPPARLRHAA
jgi:CRP-like cAMP-binding protein